MSYGYTSYNLAEAGERVNIDRGGGTIAEYRFGWPWAEPVELDLGHDLYARLSPFDISSERSWLRPRSRRTFGIVVWGRVSVYVKRWGATMPLDIMDPRVVAALQEMETMAAMAMMVRPLSGSDDAT